LVVRGVFWLRRLPGVGKTRIALEFVREFWRRRGRCVVLVVVPRRVLAYNSGRK
jgi:superfamily II DNA or RNA helicase